MKWNLSQSKIASEAKKIYQSGQYKNQLLIILLIGILLLVIAIPTKTTSNKRRDLEQTDQTGEITSHEYENKQNAYVSQMEARLQNVLTEIDGVGEVSVMITLHATSEKILEKDQKNSEEKIIEQDSQGGKRENRNHNIEETTVYGNQKTEASYPYVRKELSPIIEGVVVVSEGGDNAIVVKNITEAVQALFDVDMHKIKVVKGRR